MWTRYVFCPSWPKPWTGPARRRPATFRLIAPAGISPTRNAALGVAQLAASSRALGVSTMVSSVVTCLGPSRDERRSLGVMDADRFIEPGELEDLLVVLVQPALETLL